MNEKKKFGKFYIALLSLVAFTRVALAHSHLVMTVPPAEAQVKTAPKMIMLQFSEKIEPQFSKIEVTESKSGSRVDEGKPYAPAEDPTMLHVTLKPSLKPGKYHVSWKVVSADTHKSHGEYDFTYAPQEK